MRWVSFFISFDVRVLTKQMGWNLTALKLAETRGIIHDKLDTQTNIRRRPITKHVSPVPVFALFVLQRLPDVFSTTPASAAPYRASTTRVACTSRD